MLAEAERCHWCGCFISDDLPPNHPQKATAEHLVPVSKGGSMTDEANMVAACRQCNIRRGNRDADKWRDPDLPGTEEW